MRFLMLLGGSQASALPAYCEQIARDGVLLDAAALEPQGPDGPAAYALIEVRTRDEALEWSRRWPAGRVELLGVVEADERKGSTMKRSFRFTADIDAPRQKVWDAMLGPDSYREWTSAFCEGSYYEGRWDVGQRIRFLSPGGGGMVAEIAQHRPPEFVSIRHLGEVQPGGAEDTTSQTVRAWAPAYENYTLSEIDGGRTRVQVDMDILPAYEDFMKDAWPKALARLKSLAERG